MSIVRRYGLPRAVAKAACLLFMSASVTGAAPAAPVRLLVFGDSLVAGYGLPAQDGFQAQLGAALKAAGYSVEILDGGGVR